MHPMSNKILVAAAALLATLAWPTADAAAQTLKLRLDLPVMAPLGYTANVGLGVTGGLQLEARSGLGLGLSVGAIHVSEQSEFTALMLPLMAHGSYTFGGLFSGVEPYLEAGLGYTHALGTDSSAHWLSAAAGGGVLFQLVRNVQLNVGAQLLLPDLRGRSSDPLAMMLRFGVMNRLL